jgi:SAM-dependent methyltransferase
MEADLPALYGTYYPRKSLTAESVAAQTGRGNGMLARLRRWCMGDDNQGQYLIRAGERMLDIGCGSGASLLYAQSAGAQAYGIEADPNVQQIAKKLGLNIHQGNLGDQPFPGVQFDLIVMNQVIEHIPEPDKTLKLAVERLAPGGRMALVFPNRASLWCRLAGTRWINWHIPYHLHHFHMGTFQRLAMRSGLEVTHSRTVTPNLWTLLQLRASRYQPTQGIPSPIWRVNPSTTSEAYKVPSTRILRRVLLALALGMFAVINRCVDAIGQGDCLLVELKRAKSS